jgi:hypothetical protein
MLSVMRLTRLLFICFFLLPACQEDPPEGYSVVVCGDLEVPGEIDAIRVSVYREDRSEAWSGVVELEGGASGMPVSMSQDAGPMGFPDGGSGEPVPVEDPGVNAGWLGGPCEIPSDCGHGQAVCFTDADGYPGGLCTKTCDRNCPNRAETPKVLCIGEIGQPFGFEEGACVQRCDVEALPPSGCRPGYVCTTRGRFDNGNMREVCLPRQVVTPDASIADAGGPDDAGTPDAAGDAGPAPVMMTPSRRYSSQTVPNPPNAWIRAQGLSRGVVRVTAEARPASTIRLGLSRACLGVRCPLGQTCLAGLCETVPVGGRCP